MPIVAAKRAAGEVHFCDVIELAPARIHLHSTVMKKVIGAADAWRDLVAPTKMKCGEAVGVERRESLFIEAQSKTQTQSRSSDSPAILNVKCLSLGFGRAGIRHRSSAHMEVAV